MKKIKDYIVSNWNKLELTTKMVVIMFGITVLYIITGLLK
tara:strand:+ start:3646 stop:3765 length:120 start_codon:yes stop_codon:yes gene_type:complete